MSGFCVNCGTKLPDKAGFCPKCGTKIEIPRCPACGKEVDFDTAFCIHCGSRLHPVRPEPEQAPVPEPAARLRPEPVKRQPIETKQPPQAEREPRRTAGSKSAAAAAVEEERKYLVVCRHPNPYLSLFVKIKYDIILGAEKLTIRDNSADGADSATGKELRYSDLLFAEIDRVMGGWNLICCLALVWFMLLGIAMHPERAPALLPVVLIVALVCWTMYMPRIRILQKNGEYEYISGRGKRHMSELCADIQTRIVAQPDHRKTEELSEIVEKKTSYYLPQFEKLKRGEKAKFNWAAFFFNGGFYYYRKCGKAFWRLYGSLYLFLAVGMAALTATCGAAMKSSETAEIWWLSLGVVSLTASIYVLVCVIRGGKRFNREYYQQCLLRAECPVITDKEKGTSLRRAILFLVAISLCAGLSGGVCGSVIAHSVLASFGFGIEDPLWNETEEPAGTKTPVDSEDPANPEIIYENYIIIEENDYLDLDSWTEICVNIKYWDEKYDSTVAFSIFDTPDYGTLESKTASYYEYLGLSDRDAMLGFTADGQHICFYRGDEFPVNLNDVPYDIVDVFHILGNESSTVQDFAMGTMYYMNMLYSESTSTDSAYDAATVLYLRDWGYYSFKHILLSINTPNGLEPLPADKKTAVLQRAIDLREQLRNAGDSEMLFDQLMKEYSQDDRDENGNLYAPNGYTVGKGEMISEVETETRVLWIGEISEPVESSYGYHIILRTEPDWAGIITAIRTQLYAMGEPSYPASVGVDVSELVGVWEDSEFEGNYLFIGYGDSAMQNAYAYMLTEDGIEVELTEGTGDYASGLIMGRGNEPAYSIDIARYKMTLEVSIYVGETGSEAYYTFVPADMAYCPYDNPYYVG